MPFITQGKTNWKFLVIVIILAVIVGGGALWYVKRAEKSYQSPEIKKPEKINLKLISPNGGEVWKKGETHTISWEGAGYDFLWIVLLNEKDEMEGYLYSQNALSGSIEWDTKSANPLVSNSFISPGTYKIQIDDSHGNIDESDGFFSITY